MEPIDFVRAQPPFDQLPVDLLEAVAQQLDTVSFPQGTRILLQGGSPSRYLYIIREGAVRLEQGGRVALVLEEGETFGYASILSGSSSFDVIADENVVAYRLPDRMFRRLIEQPACAEFFLERLGTRLRRAADVDTPPLSGNLTTPIESLVSRDPVVVPSHATVADAARVMRDTRISSVLVDHDPLGILTDRDLRTRVLAEGLGPDTPVHQVMNAPAKTMPAETPLFEALLFLLQEQIHHLPVTRDGVVVGVITGTDLLRQQASSPFYLLRRVERLDEHATLAAYEREVAGTVETLLRGGLDVNHIARVVASLNDTLIRRLLVLAEQELGPPPSPYAWIVFGSEGRMEQLLLTDQDNALVYQDAKPEAQAYFGALAERVVDGLLQAGFPQCPGGFMATRWHRSLSEWNKLFQGWVNQPDAQALMEAAIFFDFRKVAGALSLEPLERTLLEAGSRGPFLPQLARSALDFQPPLGLFRRIREEEDGVDLKKGGIAPIVGLGRVYAIAAQSDARPTLQRLAAAAQAGIISREGAETLSDALRFLLRLRLREQIKALRRGETPTNRVRLDTLSGVERRHLKEAFMAIREMQDTAAARFLGGQVR